MTGDAWPRRLIGVSLNAAIDKIGSVDRLRPGSIHRPALLSAVPGGKALNAARAAAWLGLPSAAVAVVGGHAGSWLEARLGERGIAGWFVRVEGETRTCLSILDESTGKLTEFYEAGLHLPEARWIDVERALSDALEMDPAGALVLLAGSLPPGVPDDAYRRLGLLAATLGAKVAVDVVGPPLAAALEAQPWLVKVNAEEASASTGIATQDDVGVAAAARSLLSAGAKVAIVTMGVRGAVLATENGVWLAGPPPEIGPFSVGSGDALSGGFAAGLQRGAGLPDALRHGVAAGAANALRPGQGDLDPAAAHRILADCVVGPLVPKGDGPSSAR